MRIQFIKLADDVVTPNYATSGSAAVDLRAYLPEGDILLNPGEQALVGTGLRIWVEDPNYCGMMLPRSSMGSKGLILGNTVGLLDSDYQGELKMCLWNRSHEPIRICEGDRVAQLVVVRVDQFKFVETDSFEATRRGEGGFGSTGHN